MLVHYHEARKPCDDDERTEQHHVPCAQLVGESARGEARDHHPDAEGDQIYARLQRVATLGPLIMGRKGFRTVSTEQGEATPPPPHTRLYKWTWRWKIMLYVTEFLTNDISADATTVTQKVRL